MASCHQAVKWVVRKLIWLSALASLQHSALRQTASMQCDTDGVNCKGELKAKSSKMQKYAEGLQNWQKSSKSGKEEIHQHFGNEEKRMSIT